jgi:hypothetical protein
MQCTAVSVRKGGERVHSNITFRTGQPCKKARVSTFTFSNRENPAYTSTGYGGSQKIVWSFSIDLAQSDALNCIVSTTN